MVFLGLGLGTVASGALLWVSGVAPAELWRASRGSHVGSIHRPDDVIGYVLRPGASFRHRQAQFDVVYRVDDGGTRRIPGPSDGRPRVLVLGDSWTFGHGVEDGEAYPARLQALWPDLGVRNLGVMGYGPAHVLLALERALGATDDVALVLYGWTPIHLARAYLRRSHLDTTAGHRVPRLEIENGRLVVEGLAGRDEAIDDAAPGLVRAEWVRTVAAVERMRDDCAAYGVRFLLVLLPGPDAIPVFDTDTRRMRRRMRRAGVEMVDLQRGRASPKGDELFFEDDGHPTARWHRLVADAIAARLDPPVAHR